MRRFHPFPFAAILLAATLAGAAAEDRAAERLFAVEIQPLLAERCLACHGNEPEAILGGLDLTSRDSMLRGGATSDQVVVPGNAGSSLLYSAIRRTDPKLQMPPKESDYLTEDQIWKIRDWINAGAPWPDEETQRRFVAEDLAAGETAGATEI